MVYYKDYRLTIIETDGKYTLYDAKYGGRAVHQNKTKEWTDDYIQRVSKLRGRRKSTMAAVQKPKYEINVVGDSEIESVHHIGLSYDGNYYSVIFGKYMNGGFCSIPNWGIGCELSFDFKDVFWNEESLYKVLKRKGVAKAIALAIAEFEDIKSDDEIKLTTTDNTTSNGIPFPDTPKPQIIREKFGSVEVISNNEEGETKNE